MEEHCTGAQVDVDPTTAGLAGAELSADADNDVNVDTLIEDVSIDGMCGVY